MLVGVLTHLHVRLMWSAVGPSVTPDGVRWLTTELPEWIDPLVGWADDQPIQTAEGLRCEFSCSLL